MDYQNIIYEERNKIGIITFNRPKALNALNQTLIRELSIVLDLVAQKEEISVLILTGAGNKAFVAGADIKELSSLSSMQAKLLSERGHKVLAKLEALPQTVIAAVNGFALGGGMEIALASDFIYAADTAQFGLPEINLGIIPGYGGTQRLSRLVGRNMAKELILTGQIVSADEAKKIGCVNRIYSSTSLLKDTIKTAEAIALKSKIALRAAKQSINSGSNTDLKSASEIEINHFALTVASKDAQEGMLAFIEKRKACFSGTLNE